MLVTEALVETQSKLLQVTRAQMFATLIKLKRDLTDRPGGSPSNGSSNEIATKGHHFSSLLSKITHPYSTNERRDQFASVLQGISTIQWLAIQSGETQDQAHLRPQKDWDIDKRNRFHASCETDQHGITDNALRGLVAVCRQLTPNHQSSFRAGIDDGRDQFLSDILTGFS